MQTDKNNITGMQPQDEMLRRLWNEDVDEMPKSEVQHALSAFRERRCRHERLRIRKWRVVGIMKYAAMLVLPLLTAWAAWNYSAEYYADENEMVQCYVPEGKMDSLLLSDNTKVIVNAGTSIIYPASFSSHSVYRNVYVNGNCHFAVAKDRSHPFVVNMGNLKVKVLGTHFSVYSYNEDDKITVTLEEGLVKVLDKHQSMTLYPNEQLVYYRSSGKMSKNRVDAVAASLWTKGELNFQSRSLSEILADLERRYCVKFTVAESVDMKKRYTMNFKRDESIDNVLAVLTVVSGNISYKKQQNKITLYAKKGGR